MSANPMNINQEACEWVAKMHDADLSVEQAEQLRQWMAQSQAHKQELKRMAQRWDELNVLTELAVPLVPEPMTADKKQLSPNAALGFFNGLIQTVQYTFTSIFNGSLANATGGLSRTSLLTSAAVVLVLVGLVFTLPNNSMEGSQTYITAIGEQRRITLADKSIVQLNTNSAVVVSYTDSERGIQLQKGEAHFTVSHNPHRPFLVRAGNGLVRAVGTAFSVRLYERSVDVIVTEGRVALNKADALPVSTQRSLQQPAQHSLQQSTPQSTQSAISDTFTNIKLAQNTAEPAYLDAGQAAIFDTTTHSIELVQGLDRDELDRKLSWRSGLIKFSGDPLEEVVSEISRYTSLTIVILDPELRDLRVGGLFKVGETHKMFEALEVGFGVHAERINDELIHLRAVNREQ